MLNIDFNFGSPQKLAEPSKKSQKFRKNAELTDLAELHLILSKKSGSGDGFHRKKTSDSERSISIFPLITMKRRGRPPKKRSRNISGLCNQTCHSTSSSASENDDPPRKSLTPAIVDIAENSIESDDDLLKWDEMRSRVDEEEEILYRDIGLDSEVEEVSDCEEFGDEEFERKMLELAIRGVSRKTSEDDTSQWPG